jgi:predicted extracellular nuclease
MVFALIAVSGGCSAFDNGGGGDDDNDADDDDAGPDTSIYDIQQGNVEPGTRVTLAEVIVSSRVADDASGFFVMEPDGGAYSGIYVYLAGDAAGEIEPNVGDVVTLSGEYDEYYELSEITLAAVTDYEVLDSLGAPDPTVVDPSEIAPDSADAEQWEGVLVRIEDVEVTNENPDEPDDYGEFEVTGGVRVDDLFFAKGNDPNPPLGTPFDALVGLFTYSFEMFKLCPRDADDFVGDWKPTGDDDDDDATEATVYEVQQGDIPAGTTVTVTGVITSPLAYTGDTFFMQDPDGGEYSGVAIYMWDEVAGAFDGQMGDVVTVTGEVTEYYDLTEIVVKDPGDLTIDGTDDLPAPAAIGLDEAGEPWEGVLVEVSDVEVTVEPNDYGEFVVTDGDNDLLVDDLFFEQDHWLNYPIEVGNTFAAIAGILNFGYGEFKLEPREDADLTE